MTGEAVQYLGEIIDSLGIPYEFGQWSSDLRYPYWVGEFQEIPSESEAGKEESVFILTGTTDDSRLSLMNTRDLIKNVFPSEAETTLLESGSGIAVSYDTELWIPTDVPGMKRLQINLNVKEWRV